METIPGRDFRCRSFWSIMKKYFLKQLLMIIPTLLIITIISFALIRLMPADAVDTYMISHKIEKTAENVQMVEDMFGLNKPVIIQYFSWLGDIVHLDFGESYFSNQTVSSMLLAAFINTLKLALASMIWIVILTPILGISSSRKPGGLADKFTRIFSLCGTAVPPFVLGFILIRLFAIKLGIFSAISDGTWKSLVMPSFTLSISHIAYFVSMLRNGMIENKKETFVTYAKARGISDRKIRWTHLLRNSLLPLANTAGISIGGLIAGTVVVENVFSWPGLGRLIASSILSRDYPVIQGYILLIAVTYILANLFADFLSVLVDPRIRLGEGDN